MPVTPSAEIALSANFEETLRKKILRRVSKMSVKSATISSSTRARSVSAILPAASRNDCTRSRTRRLMRLELQRCRRQSRDQEREADQEDLLAARDPPDRAVEVQDRVQIAAGFGGHDPTPVSRAGGRHGGSGAMASDAQPDQLPRPVRASKGASRQRT
jgi:hypothetical protein